MVPAVVVRVHVRGEMLLEACGVRALRALKHYISGALALLLLGLGSDDDVL